MAATRSVLDNRTVEENSKPGTIEWQLQFTSFDDPITLASTPLNRRLRSTAIEGYASEMSVLPGGSIDFMVSMDPPGRFLIDVYRMGYYGGTGGRHMARLGSFKAEPQPMPMMTIERLRECAWEMSTTLTVPDDWPSGVYLAKLTREDADFGVQSYISFVIKEHRETDLLCQVSDITWQSYNKWPGNDSLYQDGTPATYYTGPNVRVSFERPYAKHQQGYDAPLSAGSGEYLMWEHPMTYWLEKQGYDVTYCSNLDLHLDAEILKTCKVFLSVGHDEYWSRNMYDVATAARDDGMSIAFFCGNSVATEVIMYDSAVTGAPARAFARKGPMDPDAKLLGLKFHGVGYGDWKVTKPEHWIYEGTGLGMGDTIPGVVGFEYHEDPADIPGLEVVASNPLYGCLNERRAPGWHKPDPTHYAVTYPGPKGNWVFNASTIWWSEGLSRPPGHIPARSSQCGGTLGVNPLVQAITSNVLDRMVRESPRR